MEDVERSGMSVVAAGIMVFPRVGAAATMIVPIAMSGGTITDGMTAMTVETAPTAEVLGAPDATLLNFLRVHLETRPVWLHRR